MGKKGRQQDNNEIGSSTFKPIGVIPASRKTYSKSTTATGPNLFDLSRNNNDLLYGPRPGPPVMQGPMPLHGPHPNPFSPQERAGAAPPSQSRTSELINEAITSLKNEGLVNTTKQFYNWAFPSEISPTVPESKDINRFKKSLFDRPSNVANSSEMQLSKEALEAIKPQYSHSDSINALIPYQEIPNDYRNTLSFSVSGDSQQLGIRNRMSEEDIKGQPLFYTYAPFVPADQHAGQRYYKLSVNDNTEGIAIVDGKLRGGTMKQYKGTNTPFSPTRVIRDVDDLVVDPANNYHTGLEEKMLMFSKNNKLVETTIGTGKDGKGNSIGRYTGGHLLIENPKTKEMIVLHGTPERMKEALGKYKKMSNIDKVNVYETDHKVYSVVPHNKGVLSGTFNRNLDNYNSSGGNFIYTKNKMERKVIPGFKRGGTVSDPSFKKGGVVRQDNRIPCLKCGNKIKSYRRGGGVTGKEALAPVVPQKEAKIAAPRKKTLFDRMYSTYRTAEDRVKYNRQFTPTSVQEQANPIGTVAWDMNPITGGADLGVNLIDLTRGTDEMKKQAAIDAGIEIATSLPWLKALKHVPRTAKKAKAPMKVPSGPKAGDEIAKMSDKEFDAMMDSDAMPDVDQVKKMSTDQVKSWLILKDVQTPEFSEARKMLLSGRAGGGEFGFSVDRPKQKWMPSSEVRHAESGAHETFFARGPRGVHRIGKQFVEGADKQRRAMDIIRNKTRLGETPSIEDYLDAGYMHSTGKDLMNRVTPRINPDFEDYFIRGQNEMRGFKHGGQVNTTTMNKIPMLKCGGRIKRYQGGGEIDAPYMQQYTNRRGRTREMGYGFQKQGEGMMHGRTRNEDQLQLLSPGRYGRIQDRYDRRVDRGRWSIHDMDPSVVDQWNKRIQEQDRQFFPAPTYQEGGSVAPYQQEQGFYPMAGINSLYELSEPQRFSSGGRTKNSIKNAFNSIYAALQGYAPMLPDINYDIDYQTDFDQKEADQEIRQFNAAINQGGQQAFSSMGGAQGMMSMGGEENVSINEGGTQWQPQPSQIPLEAPIDAPVKAAGGKRVGYNEGGATMYDGMSNSSGSYGSYLSAIGDVAKGIHTALPETEVSEHKTPLNEYAYAALQQTPWGAYADIGKMWEKIFTQGDTKGGAAIGSIADPFGASTAKAFGPGLNTGQRLASLTLPFAGSIIAQNNRNDDGSPKFRGEAEGDQWTIGSLADGGPVEGKKYAWTPTRAGMIHGPGTPKSDSIPAQANVGDFIVPWENVDRFLREIGHKYGLSKSQETNIS